MLKQYIWLNQNIEMKPLNCHPKHQNSMKTVNLQADQLIDDAIQSGATALYLNYLDISSLPEKLFELTQLKELSLSGNQLQALPEGIGKLKHLELLDLAGNALTQLPTEIEKLHQLRHLDLAYNHLTNLPQEICQLKLLNYLDCSANQLTRLPQSLFVCSELQTLRLGDNDLQYLPEEIGRLYRLNTLDLSNNNLEDLPINICNLKQINELHLNGNLLDMPFHLLSSLVYQPLKLLEHFIELKNEYQRELQEKQEKFQQQQAYEEQVSIWRTALHQIVSLQKKQEEADNGTLIAIPLPSPVALSDIISELNHLNQEARIINYLVLSLEEVEQKESLVLLEALKSIPADTVTKDQLEHIVSTLPALINGPSCAFMTLSSSDNNQTACLKFRLMCNDTLTQSIFVIYLSLKELIKKQTFAALEKDQSALSEALFRYIQANIESHKDELEHCKNHKTNQINRISSCLIQLASLKHTF